MAGAWLLFSLLGCLVVVSGRGDDQTYNSITSSAQEHYSELKPEIYTEYNPPPPPYSASSTTPYLLLPMFLHQASPAVSKQFFTPAAGSSELPTVLSSILIPPGPQPHIRVTSVNNNHGVEVWCGYSKITVRIHRDLLSFRSFVSHFRLGTCPASRVDGSVLYFQYELNACGSLLSVFLTSLIQSSVVLVFGNKMHEVYNPRCLELLQNFNLHLLTNKSISSAQVIKGQLLYANEVVYKPASQGAIIRTVPLTLPITCVYDRFYYSYKIGFLPEPRRQSFWKTMVSKQRFSIAVHNDKWEELGANDSYVLGGPMNFVVSVDFISMDRSVYVEACHVAASEDFNSTQRYDVISNFGCMVDSRRTGSQSHYVLRQMDVLRFSLDAFSFAEVAAERFYLHCTVVVGNMTASSTAKSCTYIESEHRWEELDGDATVCSCCETQCHPPVFTDVQWWAKQITVTSSPWSFIHFSSIFPETSDGLRSTMSGSILLRHNPPEETELQEEEEDLQEDEEELLVGEELEEEEE